MALTHFVSQKLLDESTDVVKEQTAGSWKARLSGRSDSGGLINKCNTGYSLILFVEELWGLSASGFRAAVLSLAAREDDLKQIIKQRIKF